MATQRKSPRHRFTHVLKVFDGESGAALGHVGDASPEGLLLVGDMGIQKGHWKRLRIEVPLGNGDTDELWVNAESMWCRHSTDPDDWLTGFNIKSSPLKSRMLLASLIHDDI